MPSALADVKQRAALHALDWVQSGMVLGLGTGSTTAHFIDLLGDRLDSGALRDIVAVPTSDRTSNHARRRGIPLVTLGSAPHLDLAIDGADEVDPRLDLIKGLGRALLREKIVEMHASHLLIVVDESKLVGRLGTKGPVPVELIPFGVDAHVGWLNTLGCRAELWLEEATGEPVVTDHGNYLARCWFPTGITDPYALALSLKQRPGVIEHGLFLDMAGTVIAAGRDGVRVLERPERVR